MTDSQKIERLAEFMAWHMEPDLYGEMFWVSSGVRDGIPVYRWKPNLDWNHWRQVEEKVMEDVRLWVAYCGLIYVDGNEKVTSMFKADLPTRVDALLAALDSTTLPTNAN